MGKHVDHLLKLLYLVNFQENGPGKKTPQAY